MQAAEIQRAQSSGEMRRSSGTHSRSRGTTAVPHLLLDDEMFAIGILSIREIIEYGFVTEVPMTPPFIRGVINLRGAVVPVVDLAVRFGRPARDNTKRTCIVIVDIESAKGSQEMGVVVDAVNEVLEIPPDDIEPPPEFGARIRSDFIKGMESSMASSSFFSMSIGSCWWMRLQSWVAWHTRRHRRQRCRGSVNENALRDPNRPIERDRGFLKLDNPNRETFPRGSRGGLAQRITAVASLAPRTEMVTT